MDTLLTVDNASDLSRTDLRRRAALLIEKRINRCRQTVCHQPCKGNVCSHVAQARKVKK